MPPKIPITRQILTKTQIPTTFLSHHIPLPTTNLSRNPRLLFTTANNNPQAPSPQQKKLPKSTNLPPRPKPPPEHEIEESFLKGSGPGGQKINKTNSAVQLKHLPTGLVIKSQATRSRTQNRAIARQLLADKLDDMTRGNESRSSIVSQVKSKKRASSAKKSRRKYRKLEGEKTGEADEMVDEEDPEVYDEELPVKRTKGEENPEGDRDVRGEKPLDKRQHEPKI